MKATILEIKFSRLLLPVLLALLPAAARADSPLPVDDKQVHMGVASCANSVCHGSVIPHIGSDIAHTEYTVWTRKDPHAQTYRDLFRDDFLAITRKLGYREPHREPRCLACHGSNVPEQYRGAKFSLEDGIGCETCHGGAEKYLATHTDKAATRAKNIANGLYPTDDIVQRARLCLSCHYGTGEHFVSHEIMGAGHPRISFEFDTFTALLEPHVIYDADYRARKPVYSHVKMWALGQAVASKSMLDMLDDKHLRAAGLFPELSLFDCHSCHHPMSQQTWQKDESTGLGPGAVTLNDSSLLMLRLVLLEVEPKLGAALSTKLRELHVASNSSPWLTKKRAGELRQIVKSAIARIDRHEFSAKQTVALTRRLLDSGIAGEYQNYIAAEQCVMAIGALVAAWNDARPFDAATARLVNESMQGLYDSVANDESFVPAQFEAALTRLRGGRRCGPRAATHSEGGTGSPRKPRGL
jgi:hypothetical protein